MGYLRNAFVDTEFVTTSRVITTALCDFDRVAIELNSCHH